MYVMEHIGSRRDDTGEVHGPWVTTLWQMTAAELRAVEREALNTLAFYERVSAEAARDWVRTGGHHTTPLYVAEWDSKTGMSKVRYARDAS